MCADLSVILRAQVGRFPVEKIKSRGGRKYLGTTASKKCTTTEMDGTQQGSVMTYTFHLSFIWNQFLFY